MPILSDLLALLRRPVTALPPPPVKGKAKPIPPDAMPLNEAELVEALARCDAERAEAWRTIDTVGDRREELLLQEGTDDRIAELGRQVDAANLLLDRLDRIEPDLRTRLREVQDANAARHFLELRDAYVAVGRTYIEYFRGLDPGPHYVAPLLALGRLMVAFPGAKSLVPAPPLLPTIDEFEEQLRQFSHIAHDPRPRRREPALVSARLRDADAAGVRAVSAMWGEPAVMEAHPRVWIELLVGEADGEGRWLKVGSRICVPGKEAEERIAAGRAVPAPTPEEE